MRLFAYIGRYVDIELECARDWASSCAMCCGYRCVISRRAGWSTVLLLEFGSGGGGGGGFSSGGNESFNSSLGFSQRCLALYFVYNKMLICGIGR